MKRKPILSKDILRIPILDPKAVLIEKCKEKLEYLNVIGCATEEDVLSVAYYYSYKVRELYNLTGFNAISKNDPFHHKNFKHFAKVCNLCIKNNWDFNIYIDSQFDRAEYWDNSDGRIYPTQLYSDRAEAHYHRYIKGKLQEHEADGTTFKAGAIKSVDEEILKALIQDCKLIKSGIEFCNVEGTTLEKKVITLYNSWMSLSPYYLSSCEWLVEIAQEYAVETKNTDVLRTVDIIKKINSNKKLREKVTNILKKVEEKLNVPETPSKEDLINFLE